MKRAFTLIELLVVIAIIGILSGIAIPAVKHMMHSNDRSQAVNLVRSTISSARMIAISQHRMAGVVFFEETGTYSRPVNSSQTAMQFFVEDYNQQQYPISPAGTTYFVSLSSERQYLPVGIKLAALADDGNGTNMAENNLANQARVILFDANGQLTMRGQLATPNLGAGIAGAYPMAYGDWRFLNQSAPQVAASASPGFFLYNKTEFDAHSFANDTIRSQWIRSNSDVVIVNGYTGGVIR